MPEQAEPVDSPDHTSALSHWLAWLERLHPSEIDLGLQRVSAVARRARLLQELPALITIAGTNGKGSVVAMLAAVYQAAGYRVGSYTSPHIACFNERIRIDGLMASDASIIAALDWVEQHRDGESLTYFEFTTLAAMHVFLQQKIEVVILEVGLGGRLDAVNIWDADCAAISSIAVDHQSWLGDDRNTIAGEKVGIARPGTPLIVGEPRPPAIIAGYADRIGAQLWQLGREFDYETGTGSDSADSATADAAVWQLRLPGRNLVLPAPALSGAHQYNNAATAIACVEAMLPRLPVDEQAMAKGLNTARLTGRFERYRLQNVEIIVDVAHNPAAASALVETLQTQMPGRKAHAVFCIMADKDIDGIITPVAPWILSWHCAELDVPRALPADTLVSRLRAAGVAAQDCHSYPDVEQALSAARSTAARANDSRSRDTGSGAALEESDFVLVFGSFYTVTAALLLLDRPCD